MMCCNGWSVVLAIWPPVGRKCYVYFVGMYAQFLFRTILVLLPLYKSLVRPILEYRSSIWNPKLKTDLTEIEKNSEESN